MFTIASESLVLSLLDPNSPEDQILQGSRFCWGGYIWQVRDRQVGNLLTGPEFPNARPNPFNGQGLPEAFRCRDQASGEPLTLLQSRGFVIGAGDVEIDASNAVVLTKPAKWEMEFTSHTARFRTSQNFGYWSVQLERTVVLSGRVLKSKTSLRNLGTAPLPLHWFPHPFMKLSDGRMTARLPASYRAPENDAYRCRNGEFQQIKTYAPGDLGLFLPLQFEPAPLTVWFAHPDLEGVVMSCDYAPSTAPVWANAHTFSIEPYLKTQVLPGESRVWTITYEFLPAKS